MIDFTSDNFEKRYSDLKSIKYGKYLLIILDEIENIVIEENSNKVNFTSSVDNITSYMNCFLSCINIRKKILIFLLKFLAEILRFSEISMISFNKLSKNPLITPKNSICTSIAVVQVFDFIKILFELNIKKTEEWTKLISGNSLILIDYIMKELYNEESNIVIIWNKFIKETSNFKERGQKNIALKEKVLLNISLLKEDIQKTSSDPNNFTKYESKLHSLRLEESFFNDSITDNNKKFRKYLEENIEILKILIKAYK